jgi:hypothetical protein
MSSLLLRSVSGCVTTRFGLDSFIRRQQHISPMSNKVYNSVWYKLEPLSENVPSLKERVLWIQIFFSQIPNLVFVIKNCDFRIRIWKLCQFWLESVSILHCQAESGFVRKYAVIRITTREPKTY